MSNKTLSQCTRSELTLRYKQGKVWLETHEVQPDTNNTLDINGRPYDSELYERCLVFLEKIEDELNRRFPNWRADESDTKNADAEKVKQFNEGQLTLDQLNKDEQLQVSRETIHPDVFWWDEVDENIIDSK